MTATERVGRYQLLEPIGVGPTGTVSRAKVFGVAGFERQFAIKRFHAELTTTAAQAQALSAAARAYGGLEHPRIARMSEFGVAQGTTFTAVELVVGLDALRLIAEARLAGTLLAAGGALALVSQAARAVGYAHGRGLTHLGLSPTNVIVTGDGDVKITDFGILSATLPHRPIDVARLAHRIQYLAPEQLASEATSAATDVFALGVLAYELVTGQRTFRGDTPQQVAQSVMTGPPAEPSLPRPIVRVLQRCLARSPFERFPDARALADALDAALRVAPVPGTRKDIGAQVKHSLERLAELHSGELSGVVAFNLQPSDMGRAPIVPVAALGQRDSQEGEFSTTEFVRPDTHVAGPTPLVGPATTTPDLPKQPATVPGLAPPPIPVPQGVSPPPIPPPLPKLGSPSTLLGIANAARPEPRTARSNPTGMPPIKSPPMIGPSKVLGAVPPPKPPQTPTAPMNAVPPDRPSETAVSPLRMSTAPVEAAPVPSLARTPVPFEQAIEIEPKRPVFGALRPSGDQPDKARTDLVIETDPGEVFGDLREVEDDHESESETILSFGARGESQSDAGRSATQSETIGGRSSTQSETIVALGDRNATDPGMGIAMSHSRGAETDEMSPLLVEKLNEAAGKPTAEISPLVAEAWRAEALSEFPHEQPVGSGHGLPAEPAGRAVPVRSPAVTLGTLAAGAPSASHGDAERNVETHGVRMPPARPRSRVPWILTGVLGALALAAVSFVVYDVLQSDDNPSKVVTAEPSDAGATRDAEPPAPDAVIAAAIGDGGTRSVTDAAVARVTQLEDARKGLPDAVVASVPQDAAIAAVTPDAGKLAPTPTPTGDSLAIASAPAGARVFIDGADAGVTPLKMPGTADRHTVALVLAGHELYIAQVDGHGAFSIPMKPITPSNGPAGIKVLKCAKDRYYVFVDGKPTGQNCPTERIGVELGPHVVEVYDVISEARRKWEIEVKDTRLSYRVKIE